MGEVDPQRVSSHFEPKCRTFRSFPTRPAPGKIEELLSHLSAAKRPLIVSGGGVTRACAGDDILVLAERLNISVCTSMTGQGTMPDDHTLSIGENGFHPHANLAMEEADFVQFVGSKMGSGVTIGWTFPKVTLNKRVAQIDINPEVMANNNENALSVVGDAKLVLSEMLAAVPEDADTSKNSPWIAHLNAYRKEFWQSAEALMIDNTTPLRPERVVRSFNQVLEASGEPALIYSDAGTPTPHITRFPKINAPKTRFAIPRAFGGLESALPATVGAWAADPTRRPIGMFGDGSFGVSVGELETLVRLQVPAILIWLTTAILVGSRVCTALRGIINALVLISCRRMAKRLPRHLA